MSKLKRSQRTSRDGGDTTRSTNGRTDFGDGVGNAFWQERLGLGNNSRLGGSPGASQDQNQDALEEEGPKTARVILSADKGGNPFTFDFWSTVHFGHAWIDVVTPDGQKDSWGYTASNPSTFPRFQPWRSVAGEVLHPDGSVGPTGTLVREVDEDQLKKAEDWGNAQGNTYNLFGMNGHSCASFAKGFFEEATGEKAPTGLFGALIASPSDLSEAMNREAAKELGQDPEAVKGDVKESET